MQKHDRNSFGRLRFLKNPPAVMLILFAVLSLSVFAGIYDKQASFPEYVGKDLSEEEMAEVIERNSPLTSYVHLSPNADFPRDSAIQKITIHHMGANLTLKRLGESFSKRDRGASSNYGIDVDGNIALYVEETDRAWTSSSPENDNMAVTIEVANETTGGVWPVSDSSFESLIELCTDICLRNGIEELVYTGDADGNLTIHKKSNPDFFGWLSIEGTVLDYPVMYTPNDPEYYLHRNFDGEYSYGGVPFIQGDCREGCGNYLMHGHNMKNGSMFAGILFYKDKSYWKEHPVISFDTPYENGEYEVMSAFYSKVYMSDEENVFKYYKYTDLTEKKVFDEYAKQVKAAALYDTGVDAEYGDEFITLSTCAYHTENGRFVVVARKKH